MSDEAREHQNRIEALANAVRHRLKDEMTAEEIVQSAQKYFEFLQGNESNSALTRERDALQAKLDALMLEHCPDEMTQEQKDNWARHQVPAEPVIPQPRPVRRDDPPNRTYIK